jgi:hypothetical protein
MKKPMADVALCKSTKVQDISTKKWCLVLVLFFSGKDSKSLWMLLKKYEMKLQKEANPGVTEADITEMSKYFKVQKRQP